MLQRDHLLQAPSIVTELPGPRARRLIDSDERYTSPSYTRVYPLFVERGSGAVVIDVDGNHFLDFMAGIAVCATGHCHPRVVAAIKRQAETLLHMCGADFYYGPLAELARKLCEIVPMQGPNLAFFTNSGAEAVEAAFKLARMHTGRNHMIAFYGAFHGRTLGALSLTASKVTQRSGFGPLIPQVSHVEYPDPYRGIGVDDSLSQIERLFRRTVPAEEVAAIIVEPIQGEGGYLVPPPDFHPRLKALAERHGILYIVDEVQSGMGRTGAMCAIEHWGVTPDIVCLAKGLASGMPLGAIVASAAIMDWPPGAHASTFGGNPVSCAAALATIRLLREALIENSATVGAHLMDGVRALMEKHALIGDVRGKGLMIGVELVRDRVTKERATQERDALVQACFRHGLLVLGAGKNAIRLSPPLVLTRSQADTALGILDEALTEVRAADQSR
jgi:4-aminobutyrate aminotransferase